MTGQLSLTQLEGCELLIKGVVTIIEGHYYEDISDIIQGNFKLLKSLLKITEYPIPRTLSVTFV